MDIKLLFLYLLKKIVMRNEFDIILICKSIYFGFYEKKVNRY